MSIIDGFLFWIGKSLAEIVLAFILILVVGYILWKLENRK